LLVLFISTNSCFSQNTKETVVTQSLPKIENYVNDFENIPLPHQEIILEKLVNSFFKEATKKIIIVTIESIEPYKNINNFSLDLSNTTDLGG
jgi:uncharacterized protein